MTSDLTKWHNQHPIFPSSLRNLKMAEIGEGGVQRLHNCGWLARAPCFAGRGGVANDPSFLTKKFSPAKKNNIFLKWSASEVPPNPLHTRACLNDPPGGGASLLTEKTLLTGKRLLAGSPLQPLKSRLKIHGYHTKKGPKTRAG